MEALNYTRRDSSCISKCFVWGSHKVATMRTAGFWDVMPSGLATSTLHGVTCQKAAIFIQQDP